MTTIRCPHCSTLVQCDATLPTDVICLVCEKRFRAEAPSTPLAVALPRDQVPTLQSINEHLKLITHHVECIAQMIFIAILFGLIGAILSVIQSP